MIHVWLVAEHDVHDRDAWIREQVTGVARWNRAPAVETNLSHHGGLLCLAASARRRVGVDVLSVPDDVGFVADTALVLSTAEIDHVRATPVGQRTRAFAHCWTRKEAFAKLRRSGLTGDLPGFTLTPRPDPTVDARLWSLDVGAAVVSVAATGVADARVVLHRT